MSVPQEAVFFFKEFFFNFSRFRSLSRPLALKKEEERKKRRTVEAPVLVLHLRQDDRAASRDLPVADLGKQFINDPAARFPEFWFPTVESRPFRRQRPNHVPSQASSSTEGLIRMAV